jgi:pilus assembly protein Flp/PilA
MRDEVVSNYLKSPESRMCVKRFLRDESGATAVEYGLLTALISVVIMGSLNVLGANLSGTFSTVTTRLADMN